MCSVCVCVWVPMRTTFDADTSQRVSHLLLQHDFVLSRLSGDMLPIKEVLRSDLLSTGSAI